LPLTLTKASSCFDWGNTDRGTFFSFDLFLTNKGRALATSVQIEITFPPFIRLLDPDTLFDPTDSFPIRPRPPEKPSISDILGSTPLIAPLSSILSRSADERKGPRVILRKAALRNNLNRWHSSCYNDLYDQVIPDQSGSAEI
jgi:hypothetical protein